MPTVSCECGAKYKIPDTSLGKKAKCKKCDAVFTLELRADGVIPLAPPEADFSAAFAGEIAAAAVAGAAPKAPAIRAVIAAPPSSASVSPPLATRGGSPTKGFGDSVLWTILFPASPENLLTFVGIWIGVGVLGLLPFVSIAVSLWYAAFRFELVESAAGGDEHLPSVSMGSDIWADWIAPALQWTGTWLFVFLPAFAYIIFQASSGTNPTDALLAMLDGINGIFDAFGTDPLLVILVGAALFMWPMVILCVALGGFGSAIRVDLMLLTIARGFPGYVVVLALVFGATAAEYYINELVLQKMAPAAGTGFSGILGRFAIVHLLVTAATIYADIVSLRAIGLFYRHFKHRFAFVWE